VSAKRWAQTLDLIVLTWETGSEIDNACFILFRTASGVQDYRQISDLIGARGTPASGALYSFTDSNVEPDVSYYYWLIDIETTSKWTVYGPVSARLPALRVLRDVSSPLESPLDGTTRTG